MDHLELGRECYGRRAWSDAYRALLCADQTTALSAGDLERLATSAYLTGRELEFERIQERLHRIHLESGDRARAVRCAFWLAVNNLIRGETGQANAWTARGQRLATGDESVEQGYLATVVAEQQLLEGETAAAYATAGQALSIGESSGDADLTVAALHAQGRALIQQGDIVAGLKLLDEMMLTVIEGRLLPVMTALMYCSVIGTCQKVYALGRAREWTCAFSNLCEQQPQMLGFTSTCLVHRAEIMQLQGAWPDALSEACRACDHAARAERKPSGAALYQQAEIHRLRGEFTKAEKAYRAASELGREPQPGLALLRLAQGRIDAACAAMRRLTNTTSDPLRRAGLLPAHLEIMLAIGEIDDARSARDELEKLANTFDADLLRAVVAQADGAIALAERQAHAALDPLRRAFELWERLDAPYEAARVRVLIGDTCRALGDDESAELEHQGARSVFRRLGAEPDLARLDAPPATAQTASTNVLTTRELQVLRLISTGSTNKEIAEELCLSERTIDRHVNNILNKLDVRSRTAATAYAYDHKLF
jgi:ATP/maltotriose-dependent transcriptional regulator MalT